MNYLRSWLPTGLLAFFLLQGCVTEPVVREPNSSRRDNSDAADAARFERELLKHITFDYLNARNNFGDPSIKEILEIAKSDDVLQLDDALAAIANRFPAYVSEYTLMKQSRSAQLSTPEFPRVILYGATAQTIVAFNAEAKHYSAGHRGGNDAIEVMNYDPKKGYEFREIRFKREMHGEDQKVDPNEIEYSNANVEISVANPNKCMLCHNFTNTHPIWSDYFKWPDAFGSEDDATFVANQSSLSRDLRLRGSIDPERKQFEAFELFRVQKQNPPSRYRHLQAIRDGFGNTLCPSEFGYRESLEDRTCKAPDGTTTSVDGFFYAGGRRSPNLKLTALLTLQEYILMIGDVLREHPGLSLAKLKTEFLRPYKMVQNFDLALDALDRYILAYGPELDLQKSLTFVAGAQTYTPPTDPQYAGRTSEEMQLAMRAAYTFQMEAPSQETLEKYNIHLEDYALNKKRIPKYNLAGSQGILREAFRFYKNAGY